MKEVLLGVCLMLGVTEVPAEAAAERQPAEAPNAASQTWAHIELKKQYPEGPQLPGLFGRARESLADAVRRFERAAEDSDISGVILRINNPTLGWGQLNEFRQAVRRVRDQGKPVYATLESVSARNYLLACACDRIILPESGRVMLYGLRAEVVFYKNLLEMLDVKADMLRVGKYKSGIEPYTRTEMSPEFREEMKALLDDYFRQMVDMIAEGRGLDRENVVAAINSGPHTAEAAAELRLIDRVAYRDEVATLVRNEQRVLDVQLADEYGKKKVDTDFSGIGGLMKLMNLMMGVEPDRSRAGRPKIAVVHAEGIIMTGRSQSGLFGDVLGSDTLVKAIHKAGDDSDVKAVVLRVNSPGGSALASDLIWRALDQVEKPVVVSMGDVAASGGYYISMGADCIFAQPGTLTGSIGVFGGKFGLQGLYNKLGITTSVVTRGENSGLMSSLNGFTDSERKAMRTMLEDVYERFTSKAAQGRNMELAELKTLAGGRIYTGAMARKAGLVDELGTLNDAVAKARELAGLNPDDEVERMLLPKPASPFEQLFGPVDSRAEGAPAASPQLLRAVREISPETAERLKAAAVVKLLSRESCLTLLPFHLTVR